MSHSCYSEVIKEEITKNIIQTAFSKTSSSSKEAKIRAALKKFYVSCTRACLTCLETHAEDRGQYLVQKVSDRTKGEAVLPSEG